METNSPVSTMIMYEDESVHISYENGTQLQLSPCGFEFVLLKTPYPAGQPLQPIDRVRQRTRFTISAYKEMMVAALSFRNKYATQPYLPEELMPADHKKFFCSISSEVQWPNVYPCEAEVGPGGEIIIRSEDGLAALMLSPSGEDFSVEFTCTISQNKPKLCSQLHLSSPPFQQHNMGRDLVISDRTIQPERMFQATAVKQHHSCCMVSSAWIQPLSFAKLHWKTVYDKLSKDVQSENTTDHLSGKTFPQDEVKCQLPQALPLTCPMPHWHRWKQDVFGKGENSDPLYSPTEAIKVIWCQGVIYRLLGETGPVVEVSLGDGSVIRSSGILNSYFIHYKSQHKLQGVQEVTYHLNSLPPDVPGQLYSVCSIVNRASRILACYNQAKQILKFPPAPDCAHKTRQVSGCLESAKTALPDEKNICIIHSRLAIVEEELKKIKRFNFLLENNTFLKGDKEYEQVVSTQEFSQDPVNQESIAEALLRTSRAIEDIDAVITAASLT